MVLFVNQPIVVLSISESTRNTKTRLLGIFDVAYPTPRLHKRLVGTHALKHRHMLVCFNTFTSTGCNKSVLLTVRGERDV